MDGTEKFATAGSCFAQHIGRHISLRGGDNYLDFEKAPPSLPDDQRARFGYGIYSCRYGNIYTSRQLVQVTQEALGDRPASEHVWERDGRFYDAIRPSVDPVGHQSPELVRQLRSEHLRNVRKMLEELDIMVFTLGLTETWISPVDGTAFPSAPGVIAGSLDLDRAKFNNLSVAEIITDMQDFWRMVKEINSSARMILTVSPVPLIATASGEHVLSATMYSKSVLRVAAHELSTQLVDVFYFPSYEIINSPQGRGYYFEPDMRTVNDHGVRHVMSHFFTGSLATAFPDRRGAGADGDDVVCDEEAIEEATEASLRRAIADSPGGDR